MFSKMARRFRPSLDYNKSYLNNWDQSCCHKFAYRISERGGKPVVEHRGLYCNRWTCDFCGFKRAESLYEEIFDKAKHFGLNVCLDLTLNPSIDTCPADSFRRIKTVWGKFRHKMNRLPGNKFKYIWIVGVNRSGDAHLHVLTNKQIDQRLLSSMWQACGGGKIVFIKKANNLKTRSMYMGANPLSRGFLRGSRRFGSSKGIKLKIWKLKTPWEIAPKMKNLDSLMHDKKIIYKRYDPAGNMEYCIIKGPYNHIRTV